MHHNVELVVVIAKILGQIIVFRTDFQFRTDIGFPNAELAAHIFQSALHFGIRHIAARKSPQNRNFQGFHVRSAGRLVVAIVRIRRIHFQHIPRIRFFTERHKERIVRVASAEYSNLQLFQIVGKVVHHLF